MNIYLIYAHRLYHQQKMHPGNPANRLRMTVIKYSPNTTHNSTSVYTPHQIVYRQGLL